MTRYTERIKFRLLKMECCNQLLCWVNPRLPTHCPECGRGCYPTVRGWVTHMDENASISYSAAAAIEMQTQQLDADITEERKFVDAIINAIGEISVGEAQSAIAAWRHEHTRSEQA